MAAERYPQRMSMPPMLTEAASSRSRGAKENKKGKNAVIASLTSLDNMFCSMAFVSLSISRRAEALIFMTPRSNRRLIDLYGFFGSLRGRL